MIAIGGHLFLNLCRCRRCCCRERERKSGRRKKQISEEVLDLIVAGMRG